MARRQQGQIIPKGERTWLVRVYAGRDEAGKRIYPSREIEGTYKQASDALNDMLHAAGKGSLVKPQKETLRAFADRWLKGKLNLSAKTRRDYEHLLKKHVYPMLGGRPVQKITLLDISMLYGSLISDRGLSARTVRYVHAVVNQVFGYAVITNVVTKNPCEHAELPKMEQHSGGDTLSFEETAQFLDHPTQQTDRLRALWRLLLTAGMRPQEALALRWIDFSPASGISVARSLQEVLPGKWIAAETVKSTNSVRQVVLSAITVNILEQHRKAQIAEILKQGAKYTRNDLIFATRTGHHFTPPNIRRWWKKALKDAGVRAVRLYDSRHTNISQELSTGANPVEVAARHGHNPQTMMRVYAHVIPGQAAQAPAAVELRLQAVRDAKQREA
jgi:integrase